MFLVNVAFVAVTVKILWSESYKTCQKPVWVTPKSKEKKKCIPKIKLKLFNNSAHFSLLRIFLFGEIKTEILNTVFFYAVQLTQLTINEILI